MPAKAGQIVIDISAGTSKFVVDMEKANAKFREFGATGKTSMKAVNAEIKMMTTGHLDNTKALASFVAKLPGVGAAMTAAFSVFGIVAFGAMIVDVGKKVLDFFKNINESAIKAKDDWTNLNNALHLSNAELDLANIKLENQLAKLNEKPGNKLAEALKEAEVAALKLGQQLDKDLESVYKLFKEQNAGVVGMIFGGSQFEDLARAAREAEVKVRDITSKEEKDLSAAKSPEEAKKVRDAAALAYDAVKEELLKPVNKRLGEETRQAGPHMADFVGYGGAHYQQMTGGTQDAKDRMTELQLAVHDINETFHRIASTNKNTDLKVEVDKLTPIAEQRKRDLEIANKLKAEFITLQQKELTGVEKLNAEDAARREKALQERNPGISDPKNYKFKSLTPDQNAAIDKIELEERKVMLKEMGKEYDILAKKVHETFLKANVEIIKSGETEYTAFMKPMLEGLKRFDEAVHKTIEERNKLIEAGNKESVDHQVRMAGITGARSGDPMATLKAQQEPERAAIQKHYDDRMKLATTNLEKSNAQIEKNTALAKLDNQLTEEKNRLTRQSISEKIHADAQSAKTGTDIINEGISSAEDRLSDNLMKLMTGQKTDIAAMMKQIGQQMIKDTVKAMMQREIDKILKRKPKPTLAAGDPGHVIVDNMPQGQDGRSENGEPLAHKPSSVGGILKGIGGFVSSLAGFAGALAGGGSGGGGGESIGSGDSTAGLTQLPSGLWQRGPEARAKGGDVDPGKPYIVGDGGEPELFSPKTAGTITPMSKLTGAGDHYYSIDARGAALGVENRIARSIDAAHSSAVSTSVRANHERQNRTPQRKS